jgi:hypothetical protein
MSDIGPIRIETVQGSSVRVLDRVLTPVVRLVSVHWHRGTIRSASISGRGGGVVLVRPVAVVEERGGKERVIPVPDATRTILRQMAILAVAIPALAILLIVANRLTRGR